MMPRRLFRRAVHRIGSRIVPRAERLESERRERDLRERDR